MSGITLITGGAGFIGSNIAAALCATRDIAVCDWLGTEDKWRNIAKAELADLIVPEQLDAYLAAHEGEVRAIVHMGAISATTERDADRIIANNYQLSRRLWTWCAQHAAQFIYASSAATYGDGEAGFEDDIDALARLRPLNAYGWSKHLFDRFVARTIARGEPAPPQWAGLKFFNVYGPNEYHKGTMKSVVAQIFPRAAAGEPVMLFKSHNPSFADGGQMRDFVYVDDCVAAVAWLLERRDVSGLFNLGTGEARSFLDLAHATFAALNRKPNIQFIDTPEEIRAKYQYFTQAAIGRLRAAGFTRPFTRLEDGVMAYVQGYLAASDPYR
ncbi:MAG: ADP-glyceromanno-heptose 6-epimerase [Alphaproteobacteria bacterium]|nr:ADP-glyceromanno-heptose 6-epimerase [Alphaproteobacteria bacterium]